MNALDRRVTLSRLYTTSWKGSEDLARDNAPACKVIPLMQALEQVYLGDVLLLSYAPGPDVDTMPRLSVPALARLALDELDGGVDRFGGVTLQVALVDVDAPNHEPPPEGWTERVLELTRGAAHPFGWYRTPNGLRLVFLPKTPVPILLADSYMSWLCGELTAAGVPLDPTTDQALRLQRAPRALRRELPRDFSGLEPLTAHPDESQLATRDAHGLASIVAYAPGMIGGSATLPRKGDLRPLRSKLTSLEIDQLHSGTFRCPTGERHGTFVRLACAIAEAFGTVDPAVPFAILRPSAQVLFAVPDGNGQLRDWTSELERICTWACAIVGGRKEAQRQEKERALEEAAELLQIAPSDVQRRLLISAGKTIFAFNERTGRYDVQVSNQHELLLALRSACPRLIGSAIYDGRDVSELLRDFGAIAEEVTYTYTPKTPQYDPNARVLYADACVQCEDLAPTYHPEVDRWLKALGGEDADRLLDWLACAPRLDRATCALYLHGSASSGKSMLGYGLARIWSEVSDHVRYSDAVGDFQHKLKRYPLIFADEEAKGKGGKTDSAQFRIIIGNSGLTINQKFRDVSYLDGAPRLLICANNADAFEIREDLDHDAVGAITLRVGYIKVDGAAAKAELERGARENGFATTREYTESWVKGGKIAEHVLYLHAMREVKEGQRLLVEGWESAFTRMLGAKAGSASTVCYIACKVIQEGMNTDAVRYWGGFFYFSSKHLHSEWETLVPGKGREAQPPSIQRLATTLTNLSNGADKVRKTARYQGSKSRVQAQYFKVPALTIAEMAEALGIGDRNDILKLAHREDEQENVTLNYPAEDEPKRSKATAKGILNA